MWQHLLKVDSGPFNVDTTTQCERDYKQPEMKVKEEDQLVELPSSVVLFRQQTNQRESNRLPERWRLQSITTKNKDGSFL